MYSDSKQLYSHYLRVKKKYEVATMVFLSIFFSCVCVCHLRGWLFNRQGVWQHNRLAGYPIWNMQYIESNWARKIKFIVGFATISIFLLHFPLCQSIHFINYPAYKPVSSFIPYTLLCRRSRLLPLQSHNCCKLSTCAHVFY